MRIIKSIRQYFKVYIRNKLIDHIDYLEDYIESAEYLSKEGGMYSSAAKGVPERRAKLAVSKRKLQTIDSNNYK